MRQMVDQMHQLEQEIARLSQELQTVVNQFHQVTLQLEQMGENALRTPAAGHGQPRQGNPGYGSQYLQGGATPYGSNYLGQTSQYFTPHRDQDAGGVGQVKQGNPSQKQQMETQQVQGHGLVQGQPIHQPPESVQSHTAIGSDTQDINLSALQAILNMDGSRNVSASQPSRQSEHTAYGRLL